MRHFLAKRTPRTHFQDLDDYFLIVGNVDCLKNFAVLAPAKLADYLVVVLVPTQTHRMSCTCTYPLLMHTARHPPHTQRAHSMYMPTTHSLVRGVAVLVSYYAHLHTCIYMQRGGTQLKQMAAQRNKQTQHRANGTLHTRTTKD